MRTRVLAVLAALILLCSGMTVCAAPKVMADGGVFDPQFYAAFYPDVYAAFGNNENLLYQHYLRYGKAEGRLPYDPASMMSRPRSGITRRCSISTTFSTGRRRAAFRMPARTLWPLRHRPLLRHPRRLPCFPATVPESARFILKRVPGPRASVSSGRTAARSSVFSFLPEPRRQRASLRGNMS